MRRPTITVIPLSNLVMDTPTSFDKDKVEQMALSMQTDGLLQEPVVRPISENPGFYEVVAGRKRVYAAREFLNWAEIQCFVYDDMDDESAESVALAENLFRTELSEDLRIKLLIRWHAIYNERYPNADGRRVSRKQAPNEAGTAQPEESAETSGECGNGNAPDTSRSAATPKPFAKVLHHTLGISESAAKRLARIARNLTEEQAATLAEHNVTGVQTDKIASLGKGGAIDQAIKLLASGVSVDESVRQAATLKVEKPPSRATVKANNARRKMGQPEVSKPRELSDEEWLSTYCGTILANLKHKVAFKADAILYRRTSEALTRFRTSIKKAVEEAKSPAGHNGSWYANTYRLIKASHPQHWLVCSSCTGTGKDTAQDKDSEVCPKCFGAAYKMKLED
jgi:hypothetical protein